MVQFRDHSVELLGSHSGGDINLHSCKDVGKETPIGPVPWARREDVLKAERQAKYHSVVIRSIESGVDHPARNCSREVSCESDVYEGACLLYTSPSPRD